MIGPLAAFSNRGCPHAAVPAGAWPPSCVRPTSRELIAAALACADERLKNPTRAPKVYGPWCRLPCLDGLAQRGDAERPKLQSFGEHSCSWPALHNGPENETYIVALQPKQSKGKWTRATVLALRERLLPGRRKAIGMAMPSKSTLSITRGRTNRNDECPSNSEPAWRVCRIIVEANLHKTVSSCACLMQFLPQGHCHGLQMRTHTRFRNSKNVGRALG